jgi:hypothetical protein
MVSYIDPTRPTEGKAYTADVRQNFDIAKSEIEYLQSGYLPLTGGLMQGPLELAFYPTTDMEAVNKKYMEDHSIGIDGGVISGPVTLKSPLILDGPMFTGIIKTLDAEVGSNRSAKPITIMAGNSDGNSPLGAYAYLQAGHSPGSGPGGEALIWGGSSVSGRGGNTALRSGYSTSGAGGSAYLSAGNSQTGTGGAVSLTAGQSTDGPGGTITITAGQSTNNNGGNVTIKSGASTNKSAGSLNLEAASNNVSATEGSAGSVSIKGGVQNSPTGYFGGNVIIRSGGSKSGHNSGYIELGTNTGDFNSGNILLTTFVKGVAGFVPGDINLSPGHNSVDDVHGKLRFNNLPTVSQTDLNTVWNNNGILNIGAGGSSGGGDYLPLTGGTITGTTRIESVVGIENVLELMSTDPDCDSLPKLKIFGEYGGGMFYTPSYGYLALQLIEDKTGVPIEGDILVFNNNNMIITAPRFTGTPSSASGSGYVYINADIVKYTGGADGGTILASNSKINCASIVASMGADLGYVDSSPIILRNLPTVSQTDVNTVWNNNGALNIGAGGGGVTAPLLLDAATPNWGLYTTDLVVGSITSNSSGIKLLSNDTTKQAYAFFHDNDGLHISSGTEASRSNDYMLFNSSDTSIGVMVPLNVYQDATFTRSIIMQNGQYIRGDDQTDVNGVGFYFAITGGSGNGTGSGGNITIAGGNTFAGPKLGDVILGGQLSSTSGASPTNGGNVSISPTALGVGPGSTGNAGNIIINRGLKDPDSTGLDGEILIKNLAITARTDLNAIWNNNGVLNIGAGAATGNFLPLTGGTLTGDLVLDGTSGIITTLDAAIGSNAGSKNLIIQAGKNDGANSYKSGDVSIYGSAAGTDGGGGGVSLNGGTGGSVTGAGGSASIAGGNAITDGAGGAAFLMGGTAKGATSTGGAVQIQAGNADAYGGPVSIKAGNSISGGDIELLAGAGTTGGGGDIELTAGNTQDTTGSVTAGDIILMPGVSASGVVGASGDLILRNLPTVPPHSGDAVWRDPVTNQLMITPT